MGNLWHDSSGQANAVLERRYSKVDDLAKVYLGEHLATVEGFFTNLPDSFSFFSFHFLQGGAVLESVVAYLLYRRWQDYGRELHAAGKGAIGDDAQLALDVHLLQFYTATEDVILHFRHVLRNSDGLQHLAALEGSLANLGQLCWQLHFLQGGTLGEGVVVDDFYCGGYTYVCQ